MLKSNDKLKAAIKIIQTLQEHNYRAYFVGGCLRDSLLGRTPKDYDIVTSAPPGVVQEIFFQTYDVGAKFGIIMVGLNGHTFDVATLRRDGEYINGRHPTNVAFTDKVQEDAARRDFTINAMYFDPIGEEFFDPFNGRKDLKDKIIKTCGYAVTRIKEDRLRILRAIRFAVQLNFDIDPNLGWVVDQSARYLPEISMERIRDEFIKILRYGPRRGLQLLYNAKLLDVIIPEVKELWGAHQDPLHHPEGDVIAHTQVVLEILNENKANDDLLLAGLLHDIGKPNTKTIKEGRIKHHGHEDIGAEMSKIILTSLKLPNSTIDKVVWLVQNHMKAHNAKEFKRKTLIKLLRSPHINDLIELQHADSMCNPKKDLKEFYLHSLKELQTKLKDVPFVDGKLLIQMGYQPGPMFRDIIQSCQEAQDEGEIKNKVQAMTFIKSLVAGYDITVGV